MNFEKVKKVKRSKVFTALDIVVLAVIAAAIGISIWVIYGAPSGSGLTVTVTAPDFTYSGALDRDNVIELEHMRVHIRDGKVWVTDADCADKICERTGEISRPGQTIVCMPRGVVITVSDESGDIQWGVG